MDLKSLTDALSTGRTTAEAIVEHIFRRISAENTHTRIFISCDYEAALIAARQSDARRRNGALLGPLDGIPIGVKDNLAVRNMATTDGTAYFRDRIAGQDATVVSKLRSAGCVIIGKLNMHEGALGATTDNPFWGQCQNPLKDGYTPGGSSGGSGAAVAADLVCLALGTDTMGSARIPAAYCGTWGLKPTRGLVSTSGLSYLSWTLDSIGPLASSAEGLRKAIAIMGGYDENDPASEPAPPEPDLEYDTGKRVIGIPDYQSLTECEPEVSARFEDFIGKLRDAEVTILPTTIAGWSPMAARRAGLLISEAEAGSLLGSDLDTGSNGFSDDFRSMLDFGRRAPAEKLASAYRKLEILGHQCRQTLKNFDAILMPTAPQRAFAHGTPAPQNQADFTALANMSGCPSVAFPLPMSDGGLPASAQLLGARWSDMRLIDIAEHLSKL